MKDIDLTKMQKLVDEIKATAEALFWFVLLVGLAFIIYIIK